MPDKGSVPNRGSNLCKAHGGGNNERALFQRSVISKLSRVELEDKFFRAIESNVFLKKQINFQEEKLKLLGTKLVRLSEQLKRETNQNLSFQPYEKLVKDQEIRIEELERINKELSQRINSLKSQTSVQQYVAALARSKRHRRVVVSEDREEQRDSNKHAIEETESEKHRATEQLEHEAECSQDDDAQPPSDTNNKIADKDAKEVEPFPEDANEMDSNDIKIHHEPSQSSKAISKYIRSALVQTDITKCYYEDISKKLLEKESTIFDLQNQLKLSKVKQNVIGEVENLFNLINQKSTKDEKRKKKSAPKKNVNVELIIQELQMERIELETQKTINSQLMQKLCEMQTKLDNYIILSSKYGETNQTSSTPKSIGISHFPGASNEIIEDKNISIQIVKETNTLESFEEGEIRPESTPNRKSSNVDIVTSARELLSKDVSKTDIAVYTPRSNDKSFSEGEVVVTQDPDKNRDKGTKMQLETEKDVTYGQNEEKRSETKPETEEFVIDAAVKVDGKEIGDATYDISNRSGTVTPSMESSCGSSCGQCLSDGEVPRGTSDRSNASEDSDGSGPHHVRVLKNNSQSNKNITAVSPEQGELVPVELKAELTLKAISEQLETCKMLIAAPYKNNMMNSKS